MAGIHHPDAVRDGERLLLVVRHEQSRDPDFELDAADLVAESRAHLGVERREGLVQEKDLGPDRERPGQRHPLLLAAGHLGCVAVRVGRQADQVEHLQGSALALRRRDPAHLQAECHVLPGDHVWEQRVRLEHHADVTLVRGHGGHVGPVDHHPAAVCLFQAREQAQRRRLSATRGSEQRHQLARRDGEGQVVECGDRAVPPLQVLEAYFHSGSLSHQPRSVRMTCWRASRRSRPRPRLKSDSRIKSTKAKSNEAAETAIDTPALARPNAAISTCRLL